jgi:hypothetical protein
MRWTPGDVMSRTASAGVLASWLASVVSLRDMMRDFSVLSHRERSNTERKSEESHLEKMGGNGQALKSKWKKWQVDQIVRLIR